jgi:hypothetical protein
MIAQVNCLNESILSIQVLGVSGLNVSSLAQFSSTTNQWYVSLAWIPTSTQKGPNILCATATDSTYQITIHCYTIVVSDTSQVITTQTMAKITTQSNLGAIVGGSIGGAIGLAAVATVAYLIITKLKASTVISAPPVPILKIPSQPPKPPKPIKTRMQAANIQNKTFNLKKIPQANNLTNIEQIVPVTPRKEPLPPPKTRMMGPLIKHKTFNLPL